MRREFDMDAAWEEALRLLEAEGENVGDVLAQGQRNIVELRGVAMPLPDGFRLFGDAPLSEVQR